MNIVIFILILLVLVIVHEFGHFFTAKRFGIRVDEFGFGFPPRLYWRRFGETVYSFNLLPIGGFVRIFGENGETEEARPNMLGLASDDSRSFVNKPRWQQAAVLFAGVFANFLLAWVLFSFGFMSGFPTSVGSSLPGYELEDVNLVVLSVVEDSPADKAGLASGDKIMYLASREEVVSEINPTTLKSFVVSHPDQELELGYIRGKSENLQFTKITPTVKNGDDKPTVGIAMDQIGTARLPFFRAYKEGMKLTLALTKETAISLYNFAVDGLRGRGSFNSVTGPVGMVRIVGDAYQFGFVYLLSFAALVSINLAIINLLPFPALDGGRLFFLLIEKIKGSRISPKVANLANSIGFALLMILMLVITYHDIVNLF